jgi:mono/diheme cytochrome c family protein
MHEGRSRDGRRLVPAFPYPSFTRVAREDNDALFAYLRSLPPVVQPAQPHALRFPYGTQAALAAWQWFNFRPAAAPRQAPAEGPARGEYLVRGLGHCGECHAPRNRWSAAGTALTGATLPGSGWYAPSLHPVPGSPVDARQTAALLRDGLHAHGTAGGPMARVVLDSTQHWTPSDRALAALYLHSLPPQPAPPAAAAASPAQATSGSRLYARHCADCHGSEGTGVPGVYPPLAGNPGVTQASIRSLVRVLWHGGFPASTAGNPRPYGMPPAELNDDEVAAVLTHLRQSWGHRAPAVSSLEVLQAR